MKKLIYLFILILPLKLFANGPAYGHAGISFLSSFEVDSITVNNKIKQSADITFGSSGYDITITADSLKGPAVLFGIDHDDLVDKSADETVAGRWSFSDLLVASDSLNTGDLTVSTGENFKVGSTEWTMASNDSIDGEVVGANTIDDDALDLADITLADFTNDNNYTQSNADEDISGKWDFQDTTKVISGSPSLVLKNTTAEDGDKKRESKIFGAGLRSGSEVDTLGYMKFSHDGSSDDSKGQWQLYTNTGSALTNVITALADGTVGIGTTSPSKELDVAGQAVFSDWIGGNGAAGSLFRIYGSMNDIGTRYLAIKDGNVGIGTTNPDDQYTQAGSKPIMTLYDFDVNLDASTAAQQKDSSAVVLDASLTEPLIKRATSTGKNLHISNFYEAWVTHEAASDTITLGALPADAIVLGVYVWVQEAFDSDGADNLIVGYDGDSDAYVTTLDVSGTGVKSPTLGATSKTVDATGRTAKAYYDDAGSDATTGEAHVVIEWLQATTNP